MRIVLLILVLPLAACGPRPEPPGTPVQAPPMTEEGDPIFRTEGDPEGQGCTYTMQDGDPVLLECDA
ncbi:hypothetical protein [Histidinibacterium aquaticum]|uniref:Uncharacterized protein n=1 Tax=Histidinibacterium aquaticum TaxID=2613962 RepID=A0A5J5GGZ0_9RHOB|nr:hypothetical protein [Histidinibacterium aquaticum]KAA9007022.1 hypothetical protein F3S47_14760 [Histidinibacterium aquaticum]